MAKELKQYTCPICKKPLVVEEGVFDKFFPFCCKRCQQIDLGQWATSSYVVPGPAVEEIESEEDLED